MNNPTPVYRYSEAKQQKNYEKFVTAGHWGRACCQCGCWQVISWADFEAGRFYLPGHAPKSNPTPAKQVDEDTPLLVNIGAWALYILLAASVIWIAIR